MAGLFCGPTKAQPLSHFGGPVGKLRLSNVLDIQLETTFDSSGSQGQFLGGL